MNKKYFIIKNKLVPYIFGGSSNIRQKLDISLPFPETSLDSNRDTNLITSTDYFYGLLALGEGPIYRINPNGPTDIEFNDASINDLIDYQTNLTNNTKLYTLSSLGNIKAPMSSEFNTYFGRTVSPQGLSSPVQLKLGNIPGVPAIDVVQNTTNFKWDALEFNFTINSLFNTDEETGELRPGSIGIKIQIQDHLGIGDFFILNSNGDKFVTATQSGIVQTPVKFSVKVEIPQDKRSDLGYRFTISKITNDSNSSRVVENITFTGWDEVTYDTLWYPRTALLGVVLKSYAEYASVVPTITSLVKGLVVKVPSNYNQPVRLLRGAPKERTSTSTTTNVTHPLYPSAGSYSYTVPAGVTRLVIDAVGGGGGAGLNTCDGSSSCYYGSGGGAASVYTRTIKTVTQGDILTVTVGAGASMGNSGGTTTVSSSAGWTISVPGGNPGASYVSDSDAGGAINSAATGIDQIISDSLNAGVAGATGGKGIYRFGTGGLGMNGIGCGMNGMLSTGASGKTGKDGFVGLFNPGQEPSVIEPKSCLTGVSSNPTTVTIVDSILETEVEIDWRHVEVPSTGELGLPTRGYLLHSTKDVIQNEIAPPIYIGTWDGTFVKEWTQNPAWIIYDLLTNKEYGLGIPEEYIDKFKFYKVAQYCDAVDPLTGRFIGVPGYADGSFRYKPLGYHRTPLEGKTDAQIKEILYREAQIGLYPGTAIRERRFVCNISINAQKQVIEVINQITALFRGILIYTGGKISLNVDLPDELPVAIFNETNILKDSFQISGIKESELMTGVEVAYLDPTNHYKKEIIKIDDPKALEELSYIENVKQIDLIGCDRRSQAYRFAQYLLASNKYIRRRVSFKTTIEAINLSVGDVIGVAQKTAGISWGFGGRVTSNTVTSGVGVANVLLEHFTVPAISNSVFTSNTYPIALRIINRQSDRVDLYLANGYSLYATGNAYPTSSSVDLVELSVNKKLNPVSKIFESITRFDANTAPVKGDVWSLGEVNPNSYGNSLSDKLFKVTSIERDSEETISIIASEYISNVYSDSDSLINYRPVIYPSPLSHAYELPPPTIFAAGNPIRQNDGLIKYDINIDLSTLDYPYRYTTYLYVSSPEDTQIVEDILFNGV